MSISDITLNSKVFSLQSVNGTKVVRACSVATLPSGLTSLVMEISHTVGSGKKANRDLVKFTGTIFSTELSKDVPFTLHMVLTLPKELSRATVMAEVSGTDKIGNDLVDLISLDTFTFLTRLAAGEFS